MAILEEIRQMQLQGVSDQEIRQSLRQRGISRNEIEEAFSQAQIKQAVDSYPQMEGSQQFEENQQLENNLAIPRPMQEERIPSPIPYFSDSAEMQPSLTNQQFSQEEYPQEAGYQQEQIPQEQAPYPNEAQQYAQEYPSQGYPPQDYNYPSSQYASPSISPDTITEIAEQIVAEKLSSIKNKLEKNIDLKTTLEPKLANIEDRIQRIEKIIDQLQLSILQRVGEYGSSVLDLKKEVIETQKSFKSLSKKNSPKAKR